MGTDFNPFPKRKPLDGITAEDAGPGVAKLLSLPSRKPVNSTAVNEKQAADKAWVQDKGTLYALSADDRAGLKLRSGVDIVERKQEWIKEPLLPADTLTVVAGQPGAGKTTMAVSLAADITIGRTPISGGLRSPGVVLFLSSEDDEAALRSKFIAMGGDLHRLHVEAEDADSLWSLGQVAALEAHIVALHPVLVVIDSLTSHKPSKVDLNSHGDVAPLLVALRRLAVTHRCAFVLIHHTNKILTTDPQRKISGSIGIVATARHVLLVAPDPEKGESVSVAAIAKTNLTGQRDSYRFQISPFKWMGTTALRASDLLVEPGAEKGSTVEAAEAFLRKTLSTGAEDASRLIRMAEDGCGILRRTLQRAADNLQVVREASGLGKARKVFWKLPTIDDSDPPKERAVIDDKSLKKDEVTTRTHRSMTDDNPLKEYAAVIYGDDSPDDPLEIDFEEVGE